MTSGVLPTTRGMSLRICPFDHASRRLENCSVSALIFSAKLLDASSPSSTCNDTPPSPSSSSMPSVCSCCLSRSSCLFISSCFLSSSLSLSSCWNGFCASFFKSLRLFSIISTLCLSSPILKSIDLRAWSMLWITPISLSPMLPECSTTPFAMIEGFIKP